MNLRNIAVFALFVASASPFMPLATAARAADLWPQRTVRVIAPFAAGTDGAARLIAEQLARRWKQPVIIENRPGAEGLIIWVSLLSRQHATTIRSCTIRPHP